MLIGRGSVRGGCSMLGSIRRVDGAGIGENPQGGGAVGGLTRDAAARPIAFTKASLTRLMRGPKPAPLSPWKYSLNNFSIVPI